MIYEKLKEALKTEKLVAVATVLNGPEIGNKLLLWPDGDVEGSLGDTDLDEQVKTKALHLLQKQQAARHTFNTTTATFDVMIDVYPPSPKLIIIGAVHIAMALVTFGKVLGLHTIVIDARATFATPERFPDVDTLLVRWPADALAEMTLDEASYLVFLSHDEKLDNPALEVALKSKVRYIGALGSQKTHQRRIKALLEMGVSEADIKRIHAPVGLDLGAQKPEEIAVSIIAQIVAVKQNNN